MVSSVECQVRCSRCGHAHDEPIEWLMAHGEVECPADSCGAKIQIHIGDLRAPARTSGDPGEVFDLSKWSPKRSSNPRKPADDFPPVRTAGGRGGRRAMRRSERNG
jgi:hypothetical protein